MAKANKKDLEPAVSPEQLEAEEERKEVLRNEELFARTKKERIERM